MSASPPAHFTSKLLTVTEYL